MTEKDKILKETYTVLVEKEGCFKCSRSRKGAWGPNWVMAFLTVVVAIMVVITVNVILSYTKVNNLEIRLNDLEREIKELKIVVVEAHQAANTGLDFSKKVNGSSSRLTEILRSDEASSDEDWTDGIEGLHDDHDEASSIDYPSSNRKKRQVDLTARTQDGVEIHERGYGVSFNRSAGLRIYESLLFNGGKEPRDPSISWDVTDAPIQPHHRRNSFWTERSLRQQEGPTFDPEADQYARSPTTQRSNTYPSVVVKSSKVKPQSMLPPLIPPPPPALPPQPIQLDQRYQPSTDTPSSLQNTHKKKRHPQKKDMMKAKLVAAAALREEEDEDNALEIEPKPQQVQETIDKASQFELSTSRKNKLKKGKIVKKHLKQTSAHGEETSGVHFVAYSSNSSNTVLENEGDLQFRNDFGLYRNWRLSSRLFGSPKTRTLRQDGGTFTVRDRGLYLIYSQVYYLDSHVSNSYEVFINTEPFLHCASVKEAAAIGQTCYTSGVTLLHSGDKIFLRDVEPLRTYVINPSKTFFGLVKLRGFKF